MAPDCSGITKLTTLPEDLKRQISKTITPILRYRYSRVGLKPSPNGWFLLAKVLGLKELQQFPKEAILETLRTDRNRFVLAGDLLQVLPQGSAARHRQIHAAIPESSLPSSLALPLSMRGETRPGIAYGYSESSPLPSRAFQPPVQGRRPFRCVAVCKAHCRESRRQEQIRGVSSSFVIGTAPVYGGRAPFEH